MCRSLLYYTLPNPTPSQALKTKHDTPKYGLIYHAQLVGQAGTKLKGKVGFVLFSALCFNSCLQATLPDPFPGLGSARIYILRRQIISHLRKHGCSIADHVPKSSVTLFIVCSHILI